MIKYRFLIVGLIIAALSVPTFAFSASAGDIGDGRPYSEIADMCMSDVANSESNYSSFDNSECNSFIRGYFYGFAHGGYATISASMFKLDTDEAQLQMLERLKARSPRCFPEDYNKVTPALTNRELAVAFVTWARTNQYTDDDPGAYFLRFLMDLGECKNLKEP